MTTIGKKKSAKDLLKALEYALKRWKKVRKG